MVVGSEEAEIRKNLISAAKENEEKEKEREKKKEEDEPWGKGTVFLLLSFSMFRLIFLSNVVIVMEHF